MLEHLTERNIEIIMLTLTERCNLSCLYCYEHNKDPKVMGIDTAMRILTPSINRDTDQELHIYFHGGEPLMAFNKMKEICENVWKHNITRPHLMFATTNGTLAHGSIQNWFRDNSDRISLGLSLDGTQEMHDHNRNNSYNQIDLPFFRNTWPNQPVKMTVSRDTLPSFADGVIHIQKDLGFKVTGSFAYGEKWQTQDKQILAREMFALADFYLNHPQYEPTNILLADIDNLIVNVDPAFRWCGAGTTMKCYSMNGTKYPCQTFMPSSQKDGADNDAIKKASDCLTSSGKELLAKECVPCAIKTLCPTCYGMNFVNTGDITNKGGFHCAFAMIRAKATAYMMKHMLLNVSSYPFVSSMSKECRNAMIMGIDIVTKGLPDSVVENKIMSKISGMGYG